MNILNIYAVNIFQVLCLLYKCKENLAPEIFRPVYALKLCSKYAMRSSSNQVLTEPFCKNNYQRFSFSFRGPRLWNSIAVKGLNLPTCTSFADFFFFFFKACSLPQQLVASDLSSTGSNFAVSE